MGTWQIIHVVTYLQDFFRVGLYSPGRYGLAGVDGAAPSAIAFLPFPLFISFALQFLFLYIPHTLEILVLPHVYKSLKLHGQIDVFTEQKPKYKQNICSFS